MFAGLVSSLQNKIAKRFCLPVPVFKSWLHVLAYVRNLSPWQALETGIADLSTVTKDYLRFRAFSNF